MFFVYYSKKVLHKNSRSRWTLSSQQHLSRPAVNVSIRNQKAKQRRLWIVSWGSELLPAVCAWDRQCKEWYCHTNAPTTNALDHKVLGAWVAFFMLAHLQGRCEEGCGGELMASRRRPGRLLVLAGCCLQCASAGTACIGTANIIVDTGREKSLQWLC